MDIREMIREIERNGYRVIKITPGMRFNVEKCEELNSEGKSEDCFGCTCNICVMQD